MKCPRCSRPAQGWVWSDEPPGSHYCSLCADHCVWDEFWSVAHMRGLGPSGPRWRPGWPERTTTTKSDQTPLNGTDV